MALTIITIFISLLLIYNYYNYFKRVLSKKNEIEKRITYRSSIQYIMILLIIATFPICYYNFKYEHRISQIIYFGVLILFCISYLFLSRRLFCFKDHMVIGLNKIIRYSDINKIEFNDIRNKNKSSITFSTMNVFITITLPLNVKNDLISYMSKKSPNKIFSI